MGQAAMQEGVAHRATTADLLALGPEIRGEIIHGAVEILAPPRGEHGTTGTEVSFDIHGGYGRGVNGPGGWWIANEVLVRLPTGDEVLPDILGWKKERLAQGPRGIPVEVLPDWVCEILSPSNRRHDMVTKRKIYEKSQIPWYWQVDPELRTVTVLEWTDRGYVLNMVAMDEDELGIPPFDATPFAVARWFPPR